MPGTQPLKIILKGAGFFFVGMFFSTIFGYAYRMVIARWLGPSDYGLLSLGLAVLGIGTILTTVGLPSGVMRFVPYYRSQGRDDYLKGVILISLKIVFFLSFIITGIIYVFSEDIAYSLFHEPRFLPILGIFLVAIPFSAIKQIFIFATRGFRNAKYPVYTEQFFVQISKLFLTIVLLLLGFGIVGASVATVLPVILSTFLIFYFLEFKIYRIFRTDIKPKIEAKELFSYSWPLTFMPLIYMVLSWTDTLMLGYFLDATAVGIYNVARPTAAFVMMIPDALSQLFLPVFTGLYALKKYDEMYSVYRTISRWLFMSVLPILMIFVIFSRVIITFLFGMEYSAAAGPFAILSFGYFASIITGPGGGALATIGKTKITLITTAAAAILNIILNLILIPIYGINGAATVTAFSMITQYWLNMLLANYYLKVFPFTRGHFKPITASIFSIILIYSSIKAIFSWTPFWILPPALIIFALLYIFALLLLKAFDETDLEIMRAIEEKTGLKISCLRNFIKKYAR
jgi:O-antigen/teichoic acid export membrane protein